MFLDRTDTIIAANLDSGACHSPDLGLGHVWENHLSLQSVLSRLPSVEGGCVAADAKPNLYFCRPVIIGDAKLKAVDQAFRSYQAIQTPEIARLKSMMAQSVPASLR